MRNQIAAANWKMNLTYQEGEQLMNDIVKASIHLKGHQKAIFAVPFPYLMMAIGKTASMVNYAASAQNCYEKKSGAYTGEVSAEMLHSIGIKYCVLGHSERRAYFNESNLVLAEKIARCLESGITPIFCCGEPLDIREAGTQNSYVGAQLKESLFGFNAQQLQKMVIAYEPIWAIGTGKTATTEQAQEMHAYIRAELEKHYSHAVASDIPILYGGSVKAGNAKELFSCPDVDGGLVGGASLVAKDFIEIIKALK
ncbi:MAG: triose-phosphate isomerase [Bacteroidetes bacterium]|nr:triose-phosphate isomerase [Bacteroidota bacterium]